MEGLSIKEQAYELALDLTKKHNSIEEINNILQYDISMWNNRKIVLDAVKLILNAKN